MKDISMAIGIKKIIPDAEIPTYATNGSAGFDLRAMRVMALYTGTRKIDLTEKMVKTIEEGRITLRPGERALFGTGLAFDIPIGLEMQIRDRSGVSLKRGLKVFNSPGTIDSDYKGEVGIIIYNSTEHLATVTIGEKIAQAVIAEYKKATFLVRTSFADSERGEGGFGSTGDGL